MDAEIVLRALAAERPSGGASEDTAGYLRWWRITRAVVDALADAGAGDRAVLLSRMGL